MPHTRTPASAAEIALRIDQQHDELRNKVHRIHTVLASKDPDQSQMESLLQEFKRALVVHFAYEEDEGFFSDITTRAPRLSNEADHLCVEHRELADIAAELCRFAEVGSPSMEWWRELSTRCHEFSKHLMQHESEENKLLQEAFQSDIGTGD